MAEYQGRHRSFRVAPGVRERLAAYEESLPDSRAAFDRGTREEPRFSDVDIPALAGAPAVAGPCIHVGLFARFGDSPEGTRFCHACQREIPVSEL